MEGAVQTTLIFCLGFFLQCSKSQVDPNGLSDIEKQISGREFPSIFQAWNRADNRPDEDPLSTIARHDLYFSTPPGYQLVWNNTHQGLASGFTSASISAAQEYRQLLKQKNANLVTIAELRYRDAPASFLPEDSKWWMRNNDGTYVYGWEEGNYIRIEFRDPGFQDKVAEKAAALMKSGAVDGILLDWWTESEFWESRLALLKKVREAIGDDALILLNANNRKIPKSAPFANGIFMECWDSPDANEEKWDRNRTTLEWAEQNMRQPRINCLETWYKESRNDLNRMRATTTLVLTRSDGYCLFSDPNTLLTPDHLHNWYPFWNADLGKPVEEGKKLDNGAYRRKFSNGVAVYNPLGNEMVTIEFLKGFKSTVSGEEGMIHQVPAFDGDIFIEK